LRHNDTSRKVLSSSPLDVEFFNLPDHSSHIMALGVNSASNRNEYQEDSWEVKGGRRVRLTTLPP
jgi:hypothetical protein